MIGRDPRPGATGFFDLPPQNDREFGKNLEMSSRIGPIVPEHTQGSNRSHGSTFQVNSPNLSEPEPSAGSPCAVRMRAL
jgi:hypothetical protein